MGPGGEGPSRSPPPGFSSHGSAGGMAGKAAVIAETSSCFPLRALPAGERITGHEWLVITDLSFDETNGHDSFNE